MENSKKVTRSPGLLAAIAEAGGVRELAKALGINTSSINDWHRVPPARVAEVAIVTGLSEEEVEQ